MVVVLSSLSQAGEATAACDDEAKLGKMEDMLHCIEEIGGSLENQVRNQTNQRVHINDIFCS